MNLLADCGIMLEPQAGMTSEELLDWAATVEGLGFGYLFRSDHLMSTSGTKGADAPECWTSLAWIAASTKTLKFGSLVSPIGFRNPAVLAKMACMIHSFSHGRLQLGLGSGWFPDEFAAFGLDFPDFTTRNRRLEEALQIIEPLVHGRRADFDGKFYSAHTDCLPGPQGKVRIVLGSNATPVVKRSARFADEWNLETPTKEKFLEVQQIIGERASHPVEFSQMGPFVIARNAADLEKRVEVRMKKTGGAGSPSAYANEMRSKGGFVGLAEEFPAYISERRGWGISRFYLQTVEKDREGTAILADTLKSGV